MKEAVAGVLSQGAARARLLSCKGEERSFAASLGSKCRCLGQCLCLEERGLSHSIAQCLFCQGTLWQNGLSEWSELSAASVPTWELPLMLRMSPVLSTFDGRQWLRQCAISGFWLGRS
eukprot:715967-Amphidinium_carterae.1